MLRRFFSMLGIFVLTASSISAQQSQDPLRFVPPQAEVVIQIENPHQVLETVKKNELFQKAQKLAGLREYYDSTTFQRIYQLIAHFEKELGTTQDELLRELSAGGLVLAGKVSQPQAALLVLQSKDEKALRRFTELALEILTKELERQEVKERLVRTKYLGHELGQIGTRVNFAIVDGALLVTSDVNVLKNALDQHKHKNPQSVLQVTNFSDARRHAPRGSIGWVWVHLEEVRKIPDFQNGLAAVALDPLQTLLLGGVVNQLTRTPYITVTLSREDKEYHLNVFMPRGREGMSAIEHMILPRNDHASLPPLHVPRIVASSSYFLDLGQYWEKRREILGEKNAKGLEEADKNLAKFLGGIKLGKLLNALGTHHRVVLAYQKNSVYTTKSIQSFPAFALTVDMRDPSFAKDMNSILRTSALLATFSYGLQLKEENYKNCAMISYHFSETKKVEGDADGIRFQFNPTYVTVGHQFVMSSTSELARDLVDAIQAERKPQQSKRSAQTLLFASGLAEQIRANEEIALTQLILSQALSPKTAKQELQTILGWIEQLGTLQLHTSYGSHEFHFDMVWQPKKQ